MSFQDLKNLIGRVNRYSIIFNKENTDIRKLLPKIHFVKTKDKVSGQFQSIEYASYFAAIRTYLETCARNGVNEFTALLRLTQGQPYTISELIGEA